jgi:endoglycosylceramidase
MASSRRPMTPVVVAVGLLVVLGGVAADAPPPARASGAAEGSLASLSTGPGGVPGLSRATSVAGTIFAPGGPFLYDKRGRVVFFHGVNVVYKHPPFEVYPDPGKPWNFDAADASLIARLGFNVVRLGMTWAGLEPGTASANDPAICGRGAPSNPGQLNQAVLDRYLERLRTTVDLLGRYHVYTLLDMHQDVYNQMFEGEGAPNWAVCTDGVPSVDPPGRWSLEYGTAAADIAFHHFWTNDVVGDLQGQYDLVWGEVARFFRGNPWVLGYDPFNEPFSPSLIRFGDAHFDAELECFYTGTAHVGALIHGAPAIRCPRDDPADGVIPTILSNDPHHLIFVEPDIYASRGYPTYLGPMDFPNLVFNVHIYCGARSPVTGNPTNISTCAAEDARSLAHRTKDRPLMASPAQPGGPAWFVSEFGATSSTALVKAFTHQADDRLVGWAYWSWKYYDDPTGSSREALVMSNGRLRSTARVLSQTYPEAIAGTPVSMSFAATTGAFHLLYRPDHGVRAPTLVFVPVRLHYPHGYCVRAAGATVISGPGSELLEAVNHRSAHSVSITITRGACTDE